MDITTITSFASDLTLNSPVNRVSSDVAISPAYAGMRIFDQPIFAFGCPDDEIFIKFKSPEIIGDHHLTPSQLLPGVKTVISFFLPFTDRIRAANSENFDWPADEWLHGRIEGQLFVKELSVQLQNLLTDAGYESLVPMLDARFKSYNNEGIFSSTWSERHIAFACGLGTFGLSKGLITEKGTCGRFGSVLTALDLPKDVRRYRDPYEYCSMCGLCASNCPAGAISLEAGKDHELCNIFLEKTKAKHSPRYGCGKCQVSVPCELRIP